MTVKYEEKKFNNQMNVLKKVTVEAVWNQNGKIFRQAENSGKY